jgi:3-hydroxybutyrate dehydrogenase
MHAVLPTPRKVLPRPGPTAQSEAGVLSGRVALVTGSTRGIGAGIADVLARAGCDIVLNGRSPHRDGATCASALSNAHGVRTAHVPADLRRPDQARTLAASALDHFERIDILVNNAGIQHVAPVEAFCDERWDEVLSLNLSAAFRAIKAVLPDMRRRGWGRIVNIASVHGLVASERKCAYVAAKHGLVGLTKVVALETANEGITCNAICPGWVLTDLVRQQVDARAHAQEIAPEEAGTDLLRAKQPMHQFSTAESVGALAAFLCSEAARTITGAALTMDGGWVAV